MLVFRSLFSTVWERLFIPIVNPIACLPPSPIAQKPESTKHLLARIEDRLLLNIKTAGSGNRKTWLRGDGLDFAELREYVPGDDLRKMDWNVFARTSIPHIREYHEEKQAVYWLVVDASLSMQVGQYGSRPSKVALARELAATLGLLALKNQCKVGGVILGSEQKSSIAFEVFRPSASSNSLYAFLNKLQQIEVDSMASSLHPSPINDNKKLEISFSQLERVIKRSQHVFLFSDFLSSCFISDLELTTSENGADKKTETNWASSFSGLGRIAQKAQLFSLFIVDPMEKEGLPSVLDTMALVDPETADYAVWLDTNFSAQYQKIVKRAHEIIVKSLSKLGHCIEVSTADNPIDIIRHLVQGPETFPRLRSQM